MYNKLVSLSIPSGWAVIHNSFGDEDPVVSNGSIVNDEFYNEDLLSIEPIQFNGTNWVTDRNGYALDLGWYPEADPEGCYRMILLRGDWNNVILQFESRKRYEITRVIKQCFDLIIRGIDDKKISSLLEINKQDMKKKNIEIKLNIPKISENGSGNIPSIPVEYPEKFNSSNKYKENHEYKQSQHNFPLAG